MIRDKLNKSVQKRLRELAQHPRPRALVPGKARPAERTVAARPSLYTPAP